MKTATYKKCGENLTTVPVLNAIVLERRYQDETWGTISDNPHEIGQWLAIMQRELDEARAAYDACYERVALGKILQVAAVGVACLEQHGIVTR